MPIDPFPTLAAVQEAVGHVPAAVGAVVLLGGPTALWLFWRLVVQPRRSRYPATHNGLLWLCARCQSANEVRTSRCYRCGMRRDSIDDLRLYDGQGFVTLPRPDELSPAAEFEPASVSASLAASADRVSIAASAQPIAIAEDEWDPEPAPIATADMEPDVESGLGLADVLPPEPAGPPAAPPRRLVAVGPGFVPDAATRPVPVMADPDPDEADETIDEPGQRVGA